MELKLKIYLTGGTHEKFMGIGVLWLLQEISLEGSIRSAAAGLGISYSKAFSMLKNLEQELDCQVLERRRGGEAREGAVLTPLGKRLITLYDEFQQDVKQYANERFTEFEGALNEELAHDKESL